MSRLRECRERRMLTLDQVGEAVGTTGANLSRIETGVHFPSRRLARALADYYEIPVEDILYPDAEAPAQAQVD